MVPALKDVAVPEGKGTIREDAGDMVQAADKELLSSGVCNRTRSRLEVTPAGTKEAQGTMILFGDLFSKGERNGNK